MDLNGEDFIGIPTKRKHQGSPTVERPTKHMRDDDHDYFDVDEAEMVHPENGIGLEDLSLEQERLLPPTIAMPDSAEWQRTIESVVRNVVSIRFCQTCAFDTDAAITTEATGFVVDAEKGFILTNRHVVCPGPFWGYCVFDNHEEVSSRLFAPVEFPRTNMPFPSAMCIRSIVILSMTLGSYDSTQKP
jgi:hypothetical protein